MKSMALLFWLASAALSALGLFHVKHQVSAVEDELSAVQRSILARREATHILKAEWSYLNRPSRIAELSRRHLDLVPLGPKRVLRMSDLPYRERSLDAPMQSDTRTETRSKK